MEGLNQSDGRHEVAAKVALEALLGRCGGEVKLKSCGIVDQQPNGPQGCLKALPPGVQPVVGGQLIQVECEGLSLPSVALNLRDETLGLNCGLTMVNRNAPTVCSQAQGGDAAESFCSACDQGHRANGGGCIGGQAGIPQV